MRRRMESKRWRNRESKGREMRYMYICSVQHNVYQRSLKKTSTKLYTCSAQLSCLGGSVGRVFT